MVGWALLTWLVLSRVKKNRQPYKLDWDEPRRNRAYFYVVLVDIAFVAGMAVAIGFGSTFIPWKFNTCKSKTFESDIFSARKPFVEKCQHSALIQIMAMMNM